MRTLLTPSVDDTIFDIRIDFLGPCLVSDEVCCSFSSSSFPFTDWSGGSDLRVLGLEDFAASPPRSSVGCFTDRIRNLGNELLQRRWEREYSAENQICLQAHFWSIFLIPQTAKITGLIHLPYTCGNYYQRLHTLSQMPVLPCWLVFAVISWILLRNAGHCRGWSAHLAASWRWKRPH